MDGPHRASCRAISVPYGADSDGAWRSLTVTRVTLTCAHSHKEGDHTNGKDGVAGSIPAGGSTLRLTSGNACQFRTWDPPDRPTLLVLAFGLALERPHAGWRALPWSTVRVLDEPVPRPCAPCGMRLR